MLRAKQLFDANIQYVKNLDGLYVQLSSQVAALDLSDLLRSEIVFAVSALDKFVHDIVRTGMIEIFKGTRATTPAFDNYRINFATLTKILTASSLPVVSATPSSLPYIFPAEYWFEQEVINTHKYLSFQHPDKIAEVLSLIVNKPHKWQEIAVSMGMTQDVIRNQLSSIVDRRNKIAHEGDYNPSTGFRFDILHPDTIASVSFVESLASGIYDLCK